VCVGSIAADAPALDADAVAGAQAVEAGLRHRLIASVVESNANARGDPIAIRETEGLHLLAMPKTVSPRQLSVI
jgi:hypothetical protein